MPQTFSLYVIACRADDGVFLIVVEQRSSAAFRLQVRISRRGQCYRQAPEDTDEVESLQ